MIRKLLNISIYSLFLSCLVFSQVNPGVENLIHQWTFDDGTANDIVSLNPVNGSLIGGAKIENKALILSEQGQYLSFSGSALSLNKYSVISIEIWFKSIANSNTGYTMLAYFGNTSGGLGYNYLFISVARKDNVSRTAISNGTYNNEIYVNGPEYDDGLIHHLVSIISNDSIFFYIDGEIVGRTKNTIPLSSIGTSLAYIGKSGYNDDQTWLGTIYKISIYNKKLNKEEVKYLYNKGPEDGKLFVLSHNKLAFDEYFKFQNISISTINIKDTINIVTPSGITATPNVIYGNIDNIIVNLKYDTNYFVDSSIAFLGLDSIYMEIPVRSYRNHCYKKLYPDLENLIPDPYLSNLNNFTGWGTRYINNDINYVFCGATSGMVKGKNGGSIDVDLTGKLLPETRYRIKAKVYLIGGSFQIGIYGWSAGQADFNNIINVTEQWQDVDFSFITGKILGEKQGVFFNNYGLSGLVGYIDNWEMYAVPEIYLSTKKIDFLTNSSIKIYLRSIGLSNDIEIKVPIGFTVSKFIIPKNILKDSIDISFIGENNTEGYIYFTSGDIKDSIYVKGLLDPNLFISKSIIKLDEINDSIKLIIKGYNLKKDVTIEIPNGIRLSKNTIRTGKYIEDTILVYYDGLTDVNDFLKFSSSEINVKIQVIAHRNDECFKPSYTELKNLIIDPTCNYLIKDGWGNRSINDDPAFIYCGARSAKIENGSIERILTGIMKPNTTYHVKAKVYKVSPVKNDNMGNVTFSLFLDSITYPEQYRLIYEAMDSACKYFSKYTPFIENIPVYYNPSVPTAQAGYRTKIEFGPNTRYMWVGTAIHEMAHYFGSGTTNVWQSKMINGIWTGKHGTELMKSINGDVIHGDSQHYWPYGINYKEEITNLGSLENQRQALIYAVKIIKAMLVDDCNLPTNNPSVGIGVYGWDKNENDIFHEVTISNSWQDIDFYFVTGSELKSVQKIYFNYGTGYIDNWEMYEIISSNIQMDRKSYNLSVKLEQGIPIIELELEKKSLVDISIYDIQGKKIYSKSQLYLVGYNKNALEIKLLEGVYIIKFDFENNYITKKIISLNK